MTQKERYANMIAYFREAMPEAKSELHYHGNPFFLLVATLLSAQCTDKRVNMVTPALFRAYPTAAAMAQASQEEIFHYIRSISYPNAKSAHLLAMAQKLVSDFDGCVPANVEQLTTLPGVGRKTANVVCSVAFGMACMPVDTHVFRVANRLGLTRNSKTPLQTEEVLVRHIPEELVAIAHHWLILHGRYVCTARQPHCSECGLVDSCAHYAQEQRKTVSSSVSEAKVKAPAKAKRTPSKGKKTVKS